MVIQSHSGELILVPFEEPSYLNKEIGNTRERRKHNREHAIIWNNLVDTQHGNAWINIDPKVFLYHNQSMKRNSNIKIKIRSLLAVWFIPHVLSIENDHVKGVLIIWSDCFVVKLLIRIAWN